MDLYIIRSDVFVSLFIRDDILQKILGTGELKDQFSLYSVGFITLPFTYTYKNARATYVL